LAERNVSDASLDEGSPDHLGAALDVADAADTSGASPIAKPGAIVNKIVPAAITQPVPSAATGSGTEAVESRPDTGASAPATSGTVVVDVEEGGVEVPSFLGKSVRAALETAQDAGLDLDAIGSGTAREQSPLPGTHVGAGARVVVRFSR
jgi:hypothetical protein